MSTRLRIQRLAHNSEIENSRNKGNAKISELTVYSWILPIEAFLKVKSQDIKR